MRLVFTFPRCALIHSLCVLLLPTLLPTITPTPHTQTHQLQLSTRQLKVLQSFKHISCQASFLDRVFPIKQQQKKQEGDSTYRRKKIHTQTFCSPPRAVQSKASLYIAEVWLVRDCPSGPATGCPRSPCCPAHILDGRNTHPPFEGTHPHLTHLFPPHSP